MTAKEQLLKEVPRWTEHEAEVALRAVERDTETEGKGVGQAIAAGYRRIPQTAEENDWAMANAREAIREESW